MPRPLTRGLVLAAALASACGRSSPVVPARSQLDTTRVVLDSTPRQEDAVFTQAVVDEQPEVITCPPPPYPDVLRDAGIEGRVVLRMVLDTMGRVEPASTRVMSSPNDSLASGAARSMLACRFTPARVHGHAVRVLIEIPLDYKINHQ